MELEQSKIKLKSKKEVVVEDFFGGEHIFKEGEEVEGLYCDLSGLELIGIMINGQPNYYYKSHAETMFKLGDVE